MLKRLRALWERMTKPRKPTVVEIDRAVQELFKKSVTPNHIVVPAHYEAERWMAQHRRKKNHHKRKP